MTNHATNALPYPQPDDYTDLYATEDAARALVTLTDAATIDWDVTDKRDAFAQVTITDDRELAITGAVAGSRGTLLVTQGVGGSHGLTLPENSLCVGGGGTDPTLSTTAAKVDQLQYWFDGTNYWWTVGLDAS